MPTARKRCRYVLLSDDDDDDELPVRRRPKPSSARCKRCDDEDEDGNLAGFVVSDDCCVDASDESDDEEEEDDSDDDTPPTRCRPNRPSNVRCKRCDEDEDGNLAGFVVSDDCCVHASDESDEEEEEDEDDDDGEEDEGEEDDDDDETVEHLPTDATFGHTYKQAMRVIAKHPDFAAYVEEGEDGDTFCYRVRDSQPRRLLGDYQVLLDSIETILGRDAVREDPDPARQRYVTFDPTLAFGCDFFGCFCNQNDLKRGGLKTRYAFKDDKTGIVFLYGGECAAKQVNCQSHELKGMFEMEPCGIRRRECLE